MSSIDKSKGILSRDSKAIGDVMKLRFYPIVVDHGKRACLTDVDNKNILTLTQVGE